MKVAERSGRLSPWRDLMRGILSAALLLVCAGVRAADLYVPVDYPTIAAAVAAARAQTDAATTIHVAPGDYPESGILLDVANLTLTGLAPLVRGPDGYLRDVGMQPIRALIGTNLPVGVSVIQVKAANVRITGLVLAGLHPIPAPPPGAAPGSGGVVIAIDGALSPADGFSIEGNIVMGEGFGQGITSRMASGTIQGNRVTLLNSGSAVFGGRPEDAKTVVFRDNLVIGNSSVGAAFQGGNGSRTSSPPAADGPGSLSVEVSGNEFRRNGSDQPSFANLGLSFLLNDNTRSDTTRPARIAAHVHDNYFIENRHWGVSVAQRVNLNARQIGFEFDGAFEHNHYCGNGLNAAIFDLRQVTTTIGGNKFRYARGSTYVIHAVNDPLASLGFDLDHPAIDPDAHDYTSPTAHENAGGLLGNTLTFNDALVPTAPGPVLQRPTGVPVVGCPDLPSAQLSLRGTGLAANPPVLFLDSAPTASTPKYRDSASIRFAGGNTFMEIGTWPVRPSPGVLASVGDLDTWIGLKNSDDQGTRFDLQAELYWNDVLVAQGLTRCIQGVARDPNSAKEVRVAFPPFPATVFGGPDVLTLRVITRIGTNPNGSACGGHGNAAGVRLYFDSTNRPSSFDQNP